MTIVPIEEMFPWIIPYRPYIITIGLIMFALIAIGGTILWVSEQYEKWQDYNAIKELESKSLWDLN